MFQVQLTIIGHVQGVFYRAHAQKIATKFGLTGWIKNETNGTVSALIQGDAAAIDAFIEWAKEGSPAAYVKEVKISIKEKPKTVYKDFVIQ